MSALNDVLVFKLKGTPTELAADAIRLFLELLFPEQPPKSRQCVLELQRINDTIDECAAQWMIDDGFKLIPPRMEFVLSPKNDFTKQWMDELATFWNDVQRNDWFDEPHIPS